MNMLVGKIKELFEYEAKTARLNHELLYKDAATGLKNRAFFNLKLHNYLEADDRFSHGFLMLINFDRLKSIANTFGYDALNSLLQSISSVITEATEPNPYHIGCRIRENEFAIILPSLTEDESLQYAQKVCLLFKNHADAIFLKATPCHLNIALIPYYPHEEIKALLSRADHTLMVSLSKQKSNIEVYHIDDNQCHLYMGHNEWAKEIKAALNEKRFIFATQAVLNRHSHLLHNEILLRLKLLDKTIDASYFMPVILHFGWMSKIDKYVIGNLHTYQAQEALSINISLCFIQKSANLKWLKEQLKEIVSQPHKKICFEISNSSVMQDTVSTVEFANLLRTFGFSMGIDHFMISSANLDYLQEIRPSYLKIDAAYLIALLKGTHEELPNSSLLTLTKILNIKIIAIGVSSKELYESLQTLNIHYFQGNYVAKTQLQE
jgi:diguanylate cyclase (GGDEF)-like protein